jgi:argininosuccinate lyase
MAMLTILKGQPSGYNRDLQEDKVHIFAASDTVKASLDTAGAIVSHTKFDTKKISAGLDEGFLDATALAEYLVGKGVAFREAHGIVGTLVSACEKQNKKLAEVSLEEFKRHCGAIEKDVYENLGASKVASKYVTEGAAGVKQAKEQIAYWNKRLGER